MRRSVSNAAIATTYKSASRGNDLPWDYEVGECIDAPELIPSGCMLTPAFTSSGELVEVVALTVR